MPIVRSVRNRRVMAAKKALSRVLTTEHAGRIVNRVTGGVVPSHGLKIDTRSPVIDNRTRAKLIWRLYEGAEVRMVRAHLRAPTSVVDLGASLGVVAAAAARLMEPGGTVLGVEANPDLIDLAQRNVSTNAPQVKATIVHGAIDYTREPGEVAVFNSYPLHSRSALAIEATEKTFTAPVFTLSGLLADHQVGDYTLFMDIEGAEAGLVIKDAPALARCRQMVAEFHGTTHDGRTYSPSDLLSLVLDLGFETTASYGSVHVLTRPA